MTQLSFFGPSSGRRAVANIDGGSRGNPGPAGYGVRLELDDGAVVELKQAIAHATNNIAEYNGLLAALRWAAENGVDALHIRSDSELLVRQMNGLYRVKNPGLQPLYEEARALVRQIPQVKFEHVRRELNREADRLANEAMDDAASRQL
jgi:probable phosphoglycerate mutase